jgi:hypothetical protein
MLLFVLENLAMLLFVVTRPGDADACSKQSLLMLLFLVYKASPWCYFL